MMATDSSAPESIDADAGREIETTPPKNPKRGKRTDFTENTNGVIENGHDPLSESPPPRVFKKFETRKVDESTLETPVRVERVEENVGRSSSRSQQQLTPLQSSHSSTRNYQQIELTAVSDDEEQQSRRDVQPSSLLVADHDTMVSSFATTNGENDVIEIHEFTSADTDAYLDIYFDTLNNRLTRLIGTGDQVQQFRLAMKTRINSNTSSREYQNVLLGKINGDVVAAVLLAFPSESNTISNDNILSQSNSCLTSVHRWMARSANYAPTNTAECYIEMLGVRSNFRNHGIGAAMLECAEHFARQAGARLLTVHVNSEQLRNYFQRFAFDLDHSDASAFWKWMVERQSILKMSKPIPPESENNNESAEHMSSYINSSMVEGEDV